YAHPVDVAEVAFRLGLNFDFAGVQGEVVAAQEGFYARDVGSDFGMPVAPFGVDGLAVADEMRSGVNQSAAASACDHGFGFEDAGDAGVLQDRGDAGPVTHSRSGNPYRSEVLLNFATISSARLIPSRQASRFKYRK